MTLVYLVLLSFIFAIITIVCLAVELNRKTEALEAELEETKQEVTELREREKVREEEQKKLTEVSETDSLTGLLNRTGLKNRMPGLWHRNEKDKSPMAIMMVDINNFKMVNDTKGHLAGDQCLKDVAKALRGILRSTDFVIRWGGDEFMIILPRISQEGASEIARRARIAIEEVGETISIGIAYGIPGQDFPTVEEMIQKADDKMYQEKRQTKQ